MANSENNLLKPFNMILKDDISRYFVENISGELKPELPNIDEVSLIDYQASIDRDFASNGRKDKITFLGDIQPAEILNGIPIELGTIQELLSDDNFGAVDGSSGRITRHYLSVVLARAAFGSFSHDESLPLTDTIDNSIRYVIGWDGILRGSSASNMKRVVRLSGKLPRNESVNTVATKLQSVLEIEAIPKIITEYGDIITSLGIDGPLYQRTLVETALTEVRKAVKRGLRIFAIVKRSEDDAFIKYLKQYSQDHPVLKKSFMTWCHSDREFFGIHLKKGYRTPFYIHINRQEDQAKIPNDLKRVCSWIKLDSNRVCRVELPLVQAGSEDDPEMAEDLISIIYKLSQMNGGKLPVQFTRADKAAMISKSETEKQGALIDEYLRSIGLTYGDQDDWK